MERSTMLWLNPLFQWPWLQCRKLDLRLRRHLDEVKVPDIGESQVGPALAMGKSQVFPWEKWSFYWVRSWWNVSKYVVYWMCVGVYMIMYICMYIYIYNYYICMIVWMLAYLVYKKSIFNVLGHGDDSPIPKIFWLAYAADQKIHVLWYSMYWIYIYMNEWPI